MNAVRRLVMSFDLGLAMLRLYQIIDTAGVTANSKIGSD
jgi:hypothetical protein